MVQVQPLGVMGGDELLYPPQARQSRPRPPLRLQQGQPADYRGPPRARFAVFVRYSTLGPPARTRGLIV